jgi:hypothetical protein
VAPSDVEALRTRLAAVVAAATFVSDHLEDLHAYAYDRAAGGETKVAGGNTDDDPLGVGNPAARLLWHGLEAKLNDIETIIVGLSRAVGNLLSAGPGPDDMRGTHISKAEFKRNTKRQARRAAGGDYTPRRLIDQPPYPGA